MKFFFTASLRAKDNSFNNIFQKIYDQLSEGNNYVEASHLFGQDVDRVHQWSMEMRLDYYSAVHRKIIDCDILIAEVTYPSINIGYEVCLALESQKQIILLYQGTDSPFIDQFLTGYENTDSIQLLRYDNEFDLRRQLKHGLNTASAHVDKRFTILLPPKIINHLDQISKEERMPKSVYIRRLIEEDIERKRVN